MQVIETKVYTFDELSEEAKEKARGGYRGCALDCEWYDAVYEDAKKCAKLMGIDIERIYFSGFSSQGDGACFEGSYAYTEGAIRAIKAHAPLDTTLHQIAKDLQEAQRPASYRLEASIKQRGHYYHCKCTNIDVFNCEEPDASYNFSPEPDNFEGIREALRDLMNWIYSQLEEEYDWLNSDAQVDENIIVNGYLFTEDGEEFLT